MRFLKSSGVFFTALLLASSVFAIELQGKLEQGGLVFGKAELGSTIYLDKQLVTLDKDGYFALGFGRDASKSMTLKITDPKGNKTEQTLAIAPREDYKIQRIEGISKKIMNPKPETLKRIRSESALVRQARRQVIHRDDYRKPFVWPLTGSITGVYGSQRVYNGRPGRPHYGIDIAKPKGTPVSTPAKGVITLAHHDMFYSGGTIIVDHGYGLSSTLMHLSKVLVKVGDEVAPGDIIGEVGSTGRSTGPHLDWRMNWYKSRIDPQRLVSTMAEAISNEKRQAERDAQVKSERAAAQKALKKLEKAHD